MVNLKHRYRLIGPGSRALGSYRTLKHACKACIKQRKIRLQYIRVFDTRTGYFVDEHWIYIEGEER